MGKGKGGELYAVFVLSVGGWIEKEGGGEGGMGSRTGKTRSLRPSSFLLALGEICQGKKVLAGCGKSLRARRAFAFGPHHESVDDGSRDVQDRSPPHSRPPPPPRPPLGQHPDSPHHARVRGEGRKSPFVHFLRGAEE